MKKILSAAAFFAASAAFAGAETVTVDIIADLFGDVTATFVSGSSTPQTTLGAAQGSGNTEASGGIAFDASSVASALGDVVADSGAGVYYGLGNLGSGSGMATAGATSDGTWSVTVTCRPNYYGSWQALIVSVEDLLAKSSTATIEDLTSISYTYTTASLISAWVLSATTDEDSSETTYSATQIAVIADVLGDENATDALSTESSGSGTLSLAGVTIDEDDYLVFLVSSGQGTGGTARASTLTLVTTIPEPSAFGLLAGLGALAFAVSRRRRSRRA